MGLHPENRHSKFKDKLNCFLCQDHVKSLTMFIKFRLYVNSVYVCKLPRPAPVLASWLSR